MRWAGPDGPGLDREGGGRGSSRNLWDHAKRVLSFPLPLNPPPRSNTAIVSERSSSPHLATLFSSDPFQAHCWIGKCSERIVRIVQHKMSLKGGVFPPQDEPENDKGETRHTAGEGKLPCSMPNLSGRPGLHFSPGVEAKCMRGPSVRGAGLLARGGVLEQYGEHGKQAQRSNGGPIMCFARQLVRNAG